MKKLAITSSTRRGFKKHAMRVTTSSVEMTWRTPKRLLKLVEKVAGPIQLDPSADANPKYQFAPTSLTGPGHGVDGLSCSWRGHGVVYCNPPYGRKIKQWIVKAAESSACGPATDHIFLLVPARPDTKWFHEEILPYMTALCFWKGRMKFGGKAVAPAPFPSLIVYYGSKPKRFKKVFRKFGWVITRSTT